MSNKPSLDGTDKMAHVRLDGRPGSKPGYLNGFLQAFAEVDGHVVPIDGEQVDVLDLNAPHYGTTPAALASLSSGTEPSGQMTSGVQEICAKPISVESELRHSLSLWNAADLPFHRDSHPAVVLDSDAHSLLLRLLANPNCEEQDEGTAAEQSLVVENASLQQAIALETTTKPTRTQIFFCYSHKDETWLKRFQTMLKPAVPAEMLWDDTKIKAGSKWKEEIQQALASAKVAVLLVSEHFLASDFIRQNELPPLLKAANDEGLTILWVLLRPCLHEKEEIANYQAAHAISKPLRALSAAKCDQTIKEICEKIMSAGLSPPNPPLDS